MSNETNTPSTGADYSRPILHDVRAAYRWPHVILPVILFLVSTAGTQATFADPRGNSIMGHAAIATPSIIAAYWSIAWLFQRHRTLVTLLVRMLTGCLIVQVPLVIANSVAIFVLALLPANQRVLDALTGNHYWWDEYGPAGQAGMMAIGSYAVSGFFGIMAVLIIVLPVSTILTPRVIAEGSNLERVTKGQPRNFMGTLVFGGLGLFSLGLCLRVLLGGNITVARFSEWLARGDISTTAYDMSFLWWGIGTVCIGLGVAAMGIACIGVIVANAKRKE